MKFSEWKKYLCSWVNQCQFHEQPSTSLEDADPDKFFANYLELTRVHSSSSVALSPTLSTFLSKMYPKFKFFLNDNGSIKSKDYVFVYSILLHNACSRKLCVLLNLNSSFEQQCFSQFLEKMENTKVLTRQALHMIILEMSAVEEETTNDGIISVIDESKSVQEDATNDGIISVIDDSKTVEEEATNDGIIMVIDDSKTDVLEIMASPPKPPEDSDDNSEKLKKLTDRFPVEWKIEQLSINDDGQLSTDDDGQLLTDDDGHLWVSDDSKVSINDDSKVSINDDSKVSINDEKLFINDDSLFLNKDDSEFSIVSDNETSLLESMSTKSVTPESVNDNTEEWENLDEPILVEWQIKEIELRFHLAKERLSKGIRNANLLGESLKRATMLFSCCSHNVSHLLAKIRDSRPSIDRFTEPDGFVLSRLIILMQKHRMQVPNFNQMESIYTQILTVIDYNLSQSYTGNTQLEMRLEELQIKYKRLSNDNLQKDGQQTMKLSVLTNRNKSLLKRIAEMTKMRRMLKKKSKLNAQCSKTGLMRKVVIIGFNAHIMFIKTLKMELGLKLTVNKKIGVHIDDILICELKALIKSKDLLIVELTAKHNQFLDKIKTIINLSNTDQSIEHLVICQLIDMVHNRETEMRNQPNVAGHILDKIEAERNRLLQKLKINLKLKFNQFEKSETTEDNMIDELKELIEKKLDKRLFQNIHLTINQQLKIMKGSIEEFCDTWALAKLHLFKNEDYMMTIQEVLNKMLLSHQNLEEVIKLSAEEIENLCGESGAEKDQEIIKLNAQVDEQRKAAIDLLKTLKGTYKTTTDNDASILDSEFGFTKLHSYIQSFCLSYKQIVKKRNYLDKRAKFLAKQLNSRSVSRGQLTPSCWNQLGHLFNDLQASYGKVVSKIIVARGELNKYSQASCDYSKWIDKLREEFTIQVNIAAVQQLQELMVNSTAQEQNNDMLSQQLMFKQLQMQHAKQMRDRKFAIKRLKSKLITCRRNSGRSVAQLRQLKDKLKIANEKIQRKPHKPKGTNRLKQTRGQLNHAKFELMRMEQQLSLRDAYIRKLTHSRQLLQKKLVTKAGKIEKLRRQNEMMQLDTEGEPYADNLSDQNEKEIILDFLQQDNFELQDEFKRSLEEMETSYILALKYDLEESQNMLAAARQEVKDLQADLEHLKHSGSIEQLNILDNDEQKQSKNVAAVSPSAARRRSKIPLPKSSGGSKGEKQKQQQPNVDNSVSQPRTTSAPPTQPPPPPPTQPPPPPIAPILFNTPQQLSEFHILHDIAHSRIEQREEQLSVSKKHNKRLEADCAESKFLAKTQHKLNGDLLSFHKWQNVKYMKTQRKNKQLQAKVRKLQIKVYFAKLIQHRWSSEDGGSNLSKQLETLQFINDSLFSDLEKRQNDFFKFSDTYLELQKFIYALEKQIAAKEKQNEQLSNTLKGSQMVANKLLTKLDTLQRNVEALQSDRDLLHAQLAQDSKDFSNYFKLEKVNKELLNTLNLRKRRLLSLNDDYHNLQADFKESQSNLINLEVKYKQLEISLASREKELEQLEISKEWKCDCRKVQESNDELLKALEAQNQRLDKLESEKKALQEELKEAKDRKWNYVELEDANRELQRISDTKDKRLVELINEKKELYLKLKQCEEWKREFLHLKDATSELHEKRLEELESGRKDLLEKLKQAEVWKCEYIKIKDSSSDLQQELNAQEKLIVQLRKDNENLQEELKEAEDWNYDCVKSKDVNSELLKALDVKQEELHKLDNEKTALHEELLQASNWKSDCLKFKEANSELNTVLDLKEKRLKKLEIRNRALNMELEQSEESKCDYLKLKDANSELQNALNAKEKLLENLGNEKKYLHEELKKAEDWKCNYFNVKEANGQLLKTLNSQEDRFDKLENEKRNLHEELKRTEEWRGDYLKLKEVNKELQIELDLEGQLIEKFKNEKKYLKEKLKEAADWNCKYLKLKEENSALQNMLSAQEKLLEKSKDKTDSLHEKLKQAEKWQCDSLKLQDANSELQNELDDQDKLLEEMENERKELYEKLKQAEKWKVDYLHSKDAVIQLHNALNAQEKQLEELESEKKDLYEKLKRSEELKCAYIQLTDANNNLQNALDAKQRLIKELENEMKSSREELEETEALKGDYLKLKEANNDLKNTLEAQENRYERLQKKFEYSQAKQKHFRQKWQDYQLMEVSKTELESARRTQEQRLKIMQEEYEEQTNQSQSQNWEQQFRQREKILYELESKLAEKTKQVQLLQMGIQENQTNNSPTANEEFSKIQLRNVIEEQHERIKILQSEKNELNTKLGMCKQNVLELEKQNAAINYRMRKLDDSMKKTKPSELQNKQKDLENENMWLNLEIGRLNAIVNNNDRHEGSYSLPLASSSPYSMQDIEDNTNRSRNRSLYRDQQAEHDDRM